MQSASYTYSKGRIRSYMFGFNGQEKDNEVYGEGNSYTAEFWQYDPRLGRRWNVDPYSGKYSWQSPYAAFNNNPIFYKDPSGLEGEGTGDGPGSKLKTFGKQIEYSSNNNNQFDDGPFDRPSAPTSQTGNYSQSFTSISPRKYLTTDDGLFYKLMEPIFFDPVDERKVFNSIGIPDAGYNFDVYEVYKNVEWTYNSDMTEITLKTTTVGTLANVQTGEYADVITGKQINSVTTEKYSVVTVSQGMGFTSYEYKQLGPLVSTSTTMTYTEGSAGPSGSNCKVTICDDVQERINRYITDNGYESVMYKVNKLIKN
jgi:RHS repeat-associated protein